MRVAGSNQLPMNRMGICGGLNPHDSHNFHNVQMCGIAKFPMVYMILYVFLIKIAVGLLLEYALFPESLHGLQSSVGAT